MRLIRPLVMEKGCLKCHAHQDYQEGDVRGGVGVTVSMTKFRNIESRAMNGLLWSHGLLWGLGLGGIAFVFRLK